MLKHLRNLVLDIFDYAGNKLCSLYDQTSDAGGQAHDVVVTTERNGWKELSFTLPQLMRTEDGDVKNYRLDYIKEGYKIRLIDDEGTDWFILSETKVQHNNYTKTINVTAGHVCQLLKYKKLDLEFSDDEGNNVGTALTLLATILDGTGWEPGEVDEFKEKDGSTKYRSLKASVKTGAFKLIANMCDLFEAKPIYHGDTKTVDIKPLNPFSEPKNGALPDVLNEDVVELHYGTNVSNVTRTLNEENLITKLYAYGSYGDKTDGYCGIDECKHTVFTLSVGEGVERGAVCHVNLTDTAGVSIVRYFTADNHREIMQKVWSVKWSELDPASRMYVWDEANQCAYFLYENPEENHIDAFFTETDRTEEQNWFSFLMDFRYYRDIGLLTFDALQTIAKYQVQAPVQMALVNEKAAEYADEISVLTETIGSVDFCRLSCTISKPKNGYVTLNLLTNEYPKGVIYRTDYDKKEDKQFKWRVATELKSNGDPVHDVASIVYIVYEGEPLICEKSYLKAIDDEDNPTKITLWMPSTVTKYVAQNFRVYLFAQHNINGLLGAYETADEATQTAIESTTKNVTVKHPVYYEREEPKPSLTMLNGYGWWWKWYDDDTPSKMYFRWSDEGDTKWQLVTVSSEDINSTEGWYWYNWKKGLLWRKDSGIWRKRNETAADKRLAALFGAVCAAGQTRDKYNKGLHQNYTYTAPTVLLAGNYAFENGYGSYWVFTTTDTLSIGDTLVYDSTLSTVTQTVNGVETILETKAYRFDNVTYHVQNLFADTTLEQGTLNRETGAEVDSVYYRTGFMRAYPNTLYMCTGYSGDLNVYYYDENRRYLGYDEIDGTGGTCTSPENTKFIRVVSEHSYVSNNVSMHTLDVADKIITKEDDTYTVLHGIVGSGELKGITPLSKKFADTADQVYGVLYPELKAAQDRVTELQNEMTNALGDLYREGYWQKNDYVDGDEQKLYDDALDNLEKLSKPEAKYDITYLDLYGADRDNADNSAACDNNKIVWPDILTTSAAHLIDPEIGINTWAFVDKTEKCYDQPWKTKISINTNLTTISQHSFTDVMTHIAEVASEAKGKMSLYDRASAITENGSLAAERLEGKIDANKTMITGGSSTWWTDDRGNMVFVSADGNSAMTLTGNGFAIANSKDEWGDWNWRTFGTGEGFSADEIVAGYLSAERILAGSITAAHLDAGVAGELDLTANKSLKLMVSNLIQDTETKIAQAFINITPEQIVSKVEESETFTSKYATKTDVDDVQIGSRNYIRNSRNLIFEGVHEAIAVDDAARVGTAIVGVSKVASEN